MHVAVIGAGIIGSSIAWRLAQRGCRVTLLDKSHMGAEASWAGAGMLAPGGEVDQRSAWSEMAMASAAAYPAFIRELTEESGLTIDYQCGGAIEITVGQEEHSRLDQRVANQTALGILSQPIAPGGLARYLPSAVLPSDGIARFFPADALVDPRHVMRALRICCESRGVVIRETTPVESVEWRSGQAVISPRGGAVIHADGAVLAAGAWTSEIRMACPILQTFPVRGHLLGYHLESNLLPSILRRGHSYFVQRSSGFLIAGASSESVGFDRTIDPAVVEELRVNAERLLPLLRGLQPEAWIGFRPATPTYVPEIRALADTAIWLAYGHYRNGILLAPETARRVAEGLITAAS